MSKTRPLHELSSADSRVSWKSPAGYVEEMGTMTATRGLLPGTLRAMLPEAIERAKPITAVGSLAMSTESAAPWIALRSESRTACMHYPIRMPRRENMIIREGIGVGVGVSARVWSESGRLHRPAVHTPSEHLARPDVHAAGEFLTTTRSQRRARAGAGVGGRLSLSGDFLLVAAWVCAHPQSTVQHDVHVVACLALGKEVRVWFRVGVRGKGRGMGRGLASWKTVLPAGATMHSIDKPKYHASGFKPGETPARLSFHLRSR